MTTPSVHLGKPLVLDNSFPPAFVGAVPRPSHGAQDVVVPSGIDISISAFRRVQVVGDSPDTYISYQLNDPARTSALSLGNMSSDGALIAGLTVTNPFQWYARWSTPTAVSFTLTGLSNDGGFTGTPYPTSENSTNPAACTISEGFVVPAGETVMQGQVTYYHGANYIDGCAYTLTFQDLVVFVFWDGQGQTNDHYEGEGGQDTIVVGMGPEHALVLMSSYVADDFTYSTVWGALVKAVSDPDDPTGPGMPVQLESHEWRELPDPDGRNFYELTVATTWDDTHALLLVEVQPPYELDDPRFPPGSENNSNSRRLSVLTMVTRSGDTFTFAPQDQRIYAAFSFAATADLVRVSDTRMLCFIHEYNWTYDVPAEFQEYHTRVVLLGRSGDTISVLDSTFTALDGAPTGAALIGDNLVLSLTDSGTPHEDTFARVWDVSGDSIQLRYTSGAISDLPGYRNYDLTGAGPGYAAPSETIGYNYYNFLPYDNFGYHGAYDMVGTTAGKAVSTWGSSDVAYYQAGNWRITGIYSVEWSWDGTALTHGPVRRLLPFPRLAGGSGREPVRVAKMGDALLVSAPLASAENYSGGGAPPLYKGIAQADWITSDTSIVAPAAINFSYGYDSVLLQVMHRSPLTAVPFGFTQIAQEVHYNGIQYQTWLLRNDGYTYQPTLSFQSAGRLGVFTHTLEGKVGYGAPSYAENGTDLNNTVCSFTTPASSGAALLLVGADHVARGPGTVYDLVPNLAGRQGTDGEQADQRMTMFAQGYNSAQSPLASDVHTGDGGAIGVISMWFTKPSGPSYSTNDFNYVDVQALACNLDGTVIDVKTASNALGSFDVLNHQNYDDISSDALSDTLGIVTYTPHPYEGADRGGGGTYSPAARRLHPNDYVSWYWTTPVVRFVSFRSVVVPSTPEDPPTPLVVVDGGDLLRTRFVYGRT